MMQRALIMTFPAFEAQHLRFYYAYSKIIQYKMSKIEWLIQEFTGAKELSRFEKYAIIFIH